MRPSALAVLRSITSSYDACLACRAAYRDIGCRTVAKSALTLIDVPQSACFTQLARSH